MTKLDIKYFKGRLEEELALLEEEMGSVAIKDPNNPDNWIAKQPEENISPADANEVADTIDDYESNHAILKDFKIRYKNIKIALEKIENGTYGMCEMEDHPISEERLKAIPSARTCKNHMEE